MKHDVVALNGAPLTRVSPVGTADPEPLQDPFDKMIWSSLARMTRGASPLSYATAWFDYFSHLGITPGYRRGLARRNGELIAKGWLEILDAMGGSNGRAGTEPVQPLPERTADALCSVYDQWMNWVTGEVPRAHGVSKTSANRVAFSLRQMLEASHPRNVFWTNPDALRATREEGGANLMRGWSNLMEDLTSGDFGMHRGAERQNEVGERLALTPGKVVYRNELIELIQYDPVTPDVHAEPVLIVPAWIMKYYILDLAPGRSLVSYLVEQGYTVFAISWRNPDAEDRELGFDDYRRIGVLGALEAIGSLIPDEKIHALGYCLGGTLLSVAAAGLARDGSDPLASITLLAAQTDFSDAGELSLFIDDAQLAALEARMDTTGYLDGDQMAGAFSMLRTRDLLWRRMQDDYFLGRRGELVDLMIWNGDTTRMPYRMHSEYLRHFFLANDFSNGRIVVDDRPVAVSDIRAPIFALGTTKDHVAPWRSVFKIHLLADTEVTFALTNGGHNAGVVSPPGHPRRHHQILTKPDTEHFIDPDAWQEKADQIEGSWWPSWSAWLAQRSTNRVPQRSPKRAAIPGNLIEKSEPLAKAPGTYVFG